MTLTRTIISDPGTNWECCQSDPILALLVLQLIEKGQEIDARMGICDDGLSATEITIVKKRLRDYAGLK